MGPVFPSEAEDESWAGVKLLPGGKLVVHWRSVEEGTRGELQSAASSHLRLATTFHSPVYEILPKLIMLSTIDIQRLFSPGQNYNAI